MEWVVALFIGALGVAMIYAGIHNNAGGFIGAFTGVAPTHNKNSVGAQGAAAGSSADPSGATPPYGGGDFGPGAPTTPPTGGGSW